MAFREIAGNKTYRGWKQWAVGDSLVGVLRGTFTDSYGKEGYEIEVESCDFEDKTKEMEAGVLFGMNYTGDVARKMPHVAEGERLQVVYDGMGVVEKGQFQGKEFHKVIIQLDDEGNPDADDVSGDGAESEFSDVL